MTGTLVVPSRDGVQLFARRRQAILGLAARTAAARAGAAAAAAHTAPDLVTVGQGGPERPSDAEDVPLVAQGRQPDVQGHPPGHGGRHQRHRTPRRHRAPSVGEDDDTGKHEWTNEIDPANIARVVFWQKLFGFYWNF